MAAGTFVAAAANGPSGEPPSRAATRWAGAQVGTMIGLLAVLAAAIPVLAGGSFEAWLAVSVPAGAVAGAAVSAGYSDGSPNVERPDRRRRLPRVPRRRPDRLRFDLPRRGGTQRLVGADGRPEHDRGGRLGCGLRRLARDADPLAGRGGRRVRPPRADPASRRSRRHDADDRDRRRQRVHRPAPGREPRRPRRRRHRAQPGSRSAPRDAAAPTDA